MSDDMTKAVFFGGAAAILMWIRTRAKADKGGGGKAAHNVSNMGGEVRGDSKDTAEFKYFTYPNLPKWTAKHKSAMSKRVTPAMWARFKNTQTSSGYTHVPSP